MRTCSLFEIRRDIRPANGNDSLALEALCPGAFFFAIFIFSYIIYFDISSQFPTMEVIR